MEQRKVYRIEDNYGWKGSIIDEEYIAIERCEYLQTLGTSSIFKVVGYLMTLISEDELEAQKKDVLGDKNDKSRMV